MFRTPRRVWALATLLSTSIGSAAFAQPDNPSTQESKVSTWTLDEARSRARSESPVLRGAQARLATARADLVEARTYPFNPGIGFEAAERSGPLETSTDRGIEIGQEIEVGGQRGRRTRAAEAALEAAESAFRRADEELGHRIELAFAVGLAEERRVEIAGAELTLVEDLLSFEEKRLEAGAGTQLDLNFARAATGRVRQALQEALVARARARTALAEAVGVDPVDPPVPTGPGPEPWATLPPVFVLVERALDARPDLVADRSALEMARLQVELQRSLALPNLRASVFSRREEGDEITGGAIGIAIPLFDRNQGGIARSEAAESNAAADLAATELSVRRSVADAYARYESATQAVRALDALVVGTLEESLALLGRALEAGKVSAGEVIVLQRELVEAQRQHVQAELDLATARSDLRLAVGQPALAPRIPNPSTAGDS